ncbi:hypothetical protein Peur_030505 [Populus x canadensis]
MLFHLFFFNFIYELPDLFVFFWSNSQSVIRLAVLAKFVKSSVALLWDEEMLIQWLKYESILLTAQSMSVGIMRPKFTAIASLHDRKKRVKLLLPVHLSQGSG